MFLDVGNDLNVTTTVAHGSGGSTEQSSRQTVSGFTTTRTTTATYTSTEIAQQAGLYVTSAEGQMVAKAGNDINLTAAQIESAGGLHMEAENDINLLTVTTGYTSDVTTSKNNYARAEASDETGTQISSGGNATFVAGNDLNARAANVQAGGLLQIQAEGDVTIESGESTRSSETSSSYSDSSLFSTKRSTQQDSESQTNVIGSQFGGDQVVITSGGDLSIHGSEVLSDNGTALRADGNVSITAAYNTYETTSSSSSRSSGFGVSDGGLFLGSQSRNRSEIERASVAQGSVVGSVGGNLTIVSGHEFIQVGSDLRNL